MIKKMTVLLRKSILFSLTVLSVAACSHQKFVAEKNSFTDRNPAQVDVGNGIVEVGNGIKLQIKRGWKEAACKQIGRDVTRFDLEYCIDNSVIAINKKQSGPEKSQMDFDFRGYLYKSSTKLEKCYGTMLVDESGEPKEVDHSACEF